MSDQDLTQPHQAAEPAGSAEPAGAKPHVLHDISFERSGQQTRASGSQTLLEAAEDCGADIPSLCRAGVCGTCRTRVISGDTNCISTIRNDDDRAAGYVLACVTQVASACKVDA